MSCFPERTYAIYADGELAPEKRRPLESHLVGCRRCRELVVALREETELLGDALHERPQTLAEPASSPAPARGIALGIGPVLAAGLVLLIAAGWLLEIVQPAAERWLAPFTLRGATNMAFDLIFLLRDEAPAAFGAGLAIAAMASASALLTFALTMLLRRWQAPGMLLLTALMALALPATESRAHFGLHEHDDYTLAADEIHDGTLVVSAETMNVDGVVAGDLVAFSHRVTIRGEVQGNVIVIARQIEVPGHVTGSVYTAAGGTFVSGTVDGNVYALTEAFTLAGTGSIQGDAATLAEAAVLEGSVGRDLFVGGERGELRGPVGRNVSAWMERLTLHDGARIGGDVTAMMFEGNEVDVSSGAEVGGEVVTHERMMHHGRWLSRFAEPRFYAWLALNLAAAFVVGLMLHLLLPAVFENRVETTGAFFRTLGTGFVVLVAMPAALALCALTLVGLPLALIGMGVYLAALYIGTIVVAALIGGSLVHPQGEGWGPFGLALLAGLGLTIVAANTPFVGVLVRASIVVLGLGLLAERSRSGWRRLRGLSA